MIRRLFLKFFRRRRLQQDLEAEIEFHRHMAEASGNAIPFGNINVIQDRALDLWRFNTVENLWRDLVLAARTLGRSPGFVATALLSLGLGIGINTTMFSLAVEFLLSEPSVRDASTLVYVRQGGNSHMQPAMVESLRLSNMFKDVAGENEETYINFNDGVETHRAFAVQATKNYFTVLGTPVAQGRGWTEKDPNEVAVLHPHFWRTRLGSDPAIVGKSIRLDGRLYTVIGILPDNYRSMIGYGYSPDVFVPRFLDETILAAYARMKPGMGLGQLNAAMPALGRLLDQEFPTDHPLNTELHAAPISGFARIQKEKEALAVSLFFVVLLVVVGLVLLIACVNVAGLQLARASARRREIATRLALGASRARLLQQLLAESLLLSFGGAALGFAMALAAAQGAAAIPLPLPVPIRLQIETDWRVLAYAGMLAVIATIASGLLPTLQSLRESLSFGMQRERKLKMRRVLVAAQIAVSFIVLTTAALFLQNLVRTSSLSPGFDVRHTVRAEVHLPPNVYKDGRTIDPFIGHALEELRAIPGVEDATAARIVPFTDATTYGLDLTFPDTGEKRHAQFNWNAVSPAYFHVMDIPVLRGRAFTAQDSGGARVVIVNEEFVKTYLGTRDAIGATLIWTPDKTLYQIVGVVRGTKNMTIGENPRAQLYEPILQAHNYRPRIQFVIRSATPPALQIAAVTKALRSVEPSAGLEVQTMFSAIGLAFLPSQVGAVLMGSIGVLGLILAIIGIYGVLAYSVLRRLREIGIRIAIGASPFNVSSMVIREMSQLLLVGMCAGLIVTVFVTRPLSMFFVPGLSAADPMSYAAVIAILLLTGILAAAGPVYRAVRVDPMQCLRYE